MSDFDKIYQVHKNPWGSKPISEIIAYKDQLKPGNILDIGIGDGRNALFLAKEGFRITGIDISKEAIVALKSKAEKDGISENVHGIIADIADYPLNEKFDNVISSFTLHFLTKVDFPSVLDSIKESTRPGGLNIITDFTQDGPLYKTTTSKYWLKKNELKTLYADWEIISYTEKATRTLAKDENGSPYTQTSASLVARKPS